MLQDEAARCDAEARFPYESIAALSRNGVLRATLPAALGGYDFGAGPDGAAALFHLLYRLGEGHLSVARLLEAHINALQLVQRYGTTAQFAAAAADVQAGHLFALWVTDPLASGGVRLGPDMVLRGAKEFCSGAGAATRALITAGTPDGTRMLVVALPPGQRVRPSHIQLAGMRGAITGSVDFEGMEITPDALIGDVGDYLREPVFSAGAWRSAAAAAGGLGALVELHRSTMVKRQRDQDPHQRARFGQLVIAHETSRLWMEKAALRGCLEDDAPDAIVAYINLARLAVEAACLDGLRLTQRSLGIGGFISGQPAERICRDLATYLRQPAPDETLDRAAAHYFTAAMPGTA